MLLQVMISIEVMVVRTYLHGVQLRFLNFEQRKQSLLPEGSPELVE